MLGTRNTQRARGETKNSTARCKLAQTFKCRQVRRAVAAAPAAPGAMRRSRGRRRRTLAVSPSRRCRRISRGARRGHSGAVPPALAARFKEDPQEAAPRHGQHAARGLGGGQAAEPRGGAAVSAARLAPEHQRADRHRQLTMCAALLPPAPMAVVLEPRSLATGMRTRSTAGRASTCSCSTRCTQCSNTKKGVVADEQPPGASRTLARWTP